MQKSFFGLALVLVLSVGCGGGTAPESGSEADEAAPVVTEPAEAPAAEPEAPAAEPVRGTYPDSFVSRYPQIRELVATATPPLPLHTCS
jgi:hypothetical protein